MVKEIEDFSAKKRKKVAFASCYRTNEGEEEGIESKEKEEKTAAVTAASKQASKPTTVRKQVVDSTY